MQKMTKVGQKSEQTYEAGMAYTLFTQNKLPWPLQININGIV